jgi:hypothetical protein
MGCCSSKHKFIGNIIFRPIEIRIQKCGNPELDVIFDEASTSLKKCEEIRSTISEAFKKMIIATGSCVLRQPTFERSVTTFIILILIEITKDFKNNTEALSNFDFKKLIKFDKTPPYVHLDDDSLKELKKSFNFDISENKDIVTCKSTITGFVESLNKLKTFFFDISNTIRKLYDDSSRFVKTVKNQYNNKRDSITMKQAIDYIKIGEKNLENLLEMTHLISIFESFFADMLHASYTIADKLLSPHKLLIWKKIAQDAVKKNIFDSKMIVFVYANGEEKVRRIEDFNENIGYREGEEELRY